MLQSEPLRRVIRVFTLALLCSELQSNLMIPSSQKIPVGDFLTAEENISHASIEDSKYHASIRLKALDNNFGEGHICSGALIAPSAVLTAGECTFDYVSNIRRHPSELRVVMGTQNRYQRMEHTLVYGVTHLYTPSTFDSQSLRDNIAILMLERDVFENSYIEPVAIRRNSSMKFLPIDVKTTSWCSTKDGVPMPLLLRLNLTTLNDTRFDAGAPLMVNGELVGLMSFRIEEITQNSSPVYVDTKKHRWINEQIGDGTNQNSSIWGTIAFLLFTAFAFRKFDFKRRG